MSETPTPRTRADIARSRESFKYNAFDFAVYGGSKLLTYAFSKWRNRLEIHGREHLPRKGPALLVSNHASDMDPPLVSLLSLRPAVQVGKIELWDNPLMAWALDRYHAIPVKRGAADRRALSLAIAALNQGHLVTIFPEGARTRTGDLAAAKPGAGLIWAKTRAPMVPIYVDGTFEAKPIGSNGIAPAKIRVIAGEPSEFPLANARPPDYQRLSEFMMRRIAALKARLPD